MRRETLSPIKIKVCFLVLLAVVQLAATFFAVVPGYINVDEAFYHWMAKSFDETGGLALRNGWDDAPAREGRHPFIKVHDGKLYCQYPYLFPVVAWPFYRTLGFFGLFVLNSIAFLGVVALCFSSAKRLFQDVNLALNACLILLLATFAWEYSQAAWPHALALLFVIGSFRLMLAAFYAESERRAILMALVSGFVAGFAPGIRMDTVLILPYLTLPFLFDRPWQPLQALMLISGAIPGLTLLAATNFVKFGVINPLSYGDDAFAPTLPATDIIMASLCALVLAWIVTRSQFSHFFYRNGRKLFLISTGLLLITFFAAPQFATPVREFIKNGYVSLIDTRAMDAGLLFSSGAGEVLLPGGLRKSLMQSLPYVVLLLIPFKRVLSGSDDRPALSMLLFVLVIYVGYHCYSFVPLMGGGLSLNSRYYVACLPFIAILCSYAVREAVRWWGRPFSTFEAGATCIVTGGIYFCLTRLLAEEIHDLTFPLLVIPLLIAALLLAFLLVGLFFTSKLSHRFSMCMWVLITVAFVWAGLTALTQDYLVHRQWRAIIHFAGRMVEDVPSGSIVFADEDSFCASVRLIEKGNVRIGLMDKRVIKEFPTLLDLNLKEGHRVFGFFCNSLWKELGAGMLRSYKITGHASFPGYTVSEISRP
ncbi:MAG: ArnT family glycosyltransferase [Desulfomonilaceae bacterium]